MSHDGSRTVSSTYRCLPVDIPQEADLQEQVLLPVADPAIVYLAAISAIDTQRYEAAYVDGANRLQQAAYITIPGITPVIIILFLLSLSNIMNAGFEQIFNLYNPQVYEVADIIDTYVYRVGVLSAEFSFGAAVGLFKNVIGLVLLLLVNALARRFSEHALW